MCRRGSGRTLDHDVASDLRARDPPAAEGRLREGGASEALAETGSGRTLIRMLGRMLAGRTGLSPVMVGRTSPLSRLTGLMASSEGEPAVALVVGEAGVGKTRLLRELVSSVPARVQVLAGQAEPGSLGRPFELALDALGLDAVPEATDRLAAVVQALPRSSRRRSRPRHLRGPALGRCREPRGLRAPCGGQLRPGRCSSVRTARKS